MSGASSLFDAAWDDGALTAFATAITLELRVDDDGGARAGATRASVLGAFAAALATTNALPTPSGATTTDAGPQSRRGVALPWRGPSAAARWAWPTAWSARAAAVGVAGVLAVSLTAGAAAASLAGGPLYPLRLAIEAAVLPADPTAREVGEVGRLDSRVGEVEAAAGREDRGAMLAGLGAFAQIADETAASAVSDPVAAEQVAALVARLERLQVAPDTVSSRDAAVAAGRRLVLALSGSSAPAPWPSGGPATGAPGGTPAASPGPAGGTGAPGPGPSGASNPAATGGGGPHNGGSSASPTPGGMPSGTGGSPGSGGSGSGSGGAGAGSSATPPPAPGASASPSNGSGGGGPQPSGPGGSAGPGGGIGGGATAAPSPGSGGEAHASVVTSASPAPTPSPSGSGGGPMTGRG